MSQDLIAQFQSNSKGLRTWESQWYKFQSKNWKAWDSRKTDVSVQIQIFPLLKGVSVFLYLQAFNWLDEAHSH